MNRISIFYEHIAEAAVQSGLTLEEVCEKVKSFGYDAVEIDAKRLWDEGGAILPLLKKTGLAVNTIYYFYSFGRTEDHMIADEEEIRRVLSLCAPAECKTLLVVCGFLTEDELDRESAAYRTRRDRMRKATARMVALAEQQGVGVVMEDFDGVTAPFSTAEELLWFLENVPGLRCGFDTGNFQYSEEDAAAVLPQFLPYISGIHCKDRGWTKNDGEPKITIHDRPMYPVAVGDGDLDIKGMLTTILQTGYTGVVAAEHFGSAHQLRDMERSALYLKKILKDYYENLA